MSCLLQKQTQMPVPVPVFRQCKGEKSGYHLVLFLALYPLVYVVPCVATEVQCLLLGRCCRHSVFILNASILLYFLNNCLMLVSFAAAVQGGEHYSPILKAAN